MREHVLRSKFRGIGIAAVVQERRIMCTTLLFLGWWDIWDSFVMGLRCRYSLGLTYLHLFDHTFLSYVVICINRLPIQIQAYCGGNLSP